MKSKKVETLAIPWIGWFVLILVNAQAIAAGTVQSLSAGTHHSCAVIDAEVWCWGHNEDGQLGDGTVRNRYQPGRTQPLGQRIRQVTVGGSHSCALSEQGDAWCWGGNSNGQVCGNCQRKSTAPGLEIQPLAGLEGKTSSISAKGLHTAAVVDGQAVVWGRIGRKYQGAKYSGSPHGLMLAEIPEPVGIARAGGYRYGPAVCGVTSKGDVYCLGHRFGPKARKIEGLPGGAVDADSGEQHACALLETGVVYCWGSNYRGQLGVGKGSVGSDPVQVRKDADTPLAGVTQLSVGVSHSCAVLKDGTLVCWGSNGNGQLGLANKLRQSIFPETVRKDNGEPLRNVSMVSAGTRHSCAAADQTIYCWGSNSFGQLGQVRQDTAFQFDQEVVKLAAGDAFGCAQKVDGSIDCWGSIPTRNRRHAASKPVPTMGPDSNVDMIAAGGDHYPFFCFANSGVARCVGRVGGGLESRSNGIRLMSAGMRSVCVVSAHQVWCWGFTDEGMPRDIEIDRNPRLVEGIEGHVTAIGVGQFHQCAVADGDVWCWGYNRSGQLGNASVETSNTPVKVQGLDVRAIDVVAGTHHSCALLENGKVTCWGGLYYRNPGETKWHRSEDGLPHEVVDLEAPVTSLVAGGHTTCAILTDGDAYCWGSNIMHELVPGVSKSSSRPLKVEGLGGPAVGIAAGKNQACMVSEQGKVLCWGDTGTRVQEQAPYSAHPVAVKFPQKAQADE